MRFCTGKGQYETRSTVLSSGLPNTSPLAGTRYETISWEAIVDMVKNPPSVSKDVGQWIMTTNYHEHDARNKPKANVKRPHMVLPYDFDSGNHDFNTIYNAVSHLFPGAGFAIYSTASSKDTNKKWRALVRVKDPLQPVGYFAFQSAALEQLAEWGVQSDSVVRIATQLIYLPNKGEVYQYYIHEGPDADLRNHFLISKAAEMEVEHQQVVDTVSSKHADEGPRSILKAFREEHPTEQLLTLYGFETLNGTHWRNPYSASGSYGGFRLYEDGGWVSSSSGLNLALDQAKVGRVSSGGNMIGDGFDLYTLITCKGDKKLADAYARQCRQKQDDARYGEATVDHGENVWYATEYVDGTLNHMNPTAVANHNQRILEEQLANQQVKDEAQREAEFIEKEALKKHQGNWADDIPLDIALNEREWLAWNAPGAIGWSVRALAANFTAHTLIPSLNGAITGFGFLGQGKFVSRWNQFSTPPCVMLFNVGDTGSGKTDATTMFKTIIKRKPAEPEHKTAILRKFDSGPALNAFMGGVDGGNSKPNVFLLQNEAGGARAASAGDKHQAGVMNETVDTFTSFETGMEEGYGKTSGKTGAVRNPTFSALLSSTPGTLFSTIKESDAESGWLGRYLFTVLKEVKGNYERQERSLPPEVISHINYLKQFSAPSHIQNRSDYWQGDEHAFYLIPYTEEVSNALMEFKKECDGYAADKRRTIKERNVWARSAEACNRLLTIVGVATPGHRVTVSDVNWCARFVRCSVADTTSQMDSFIEIDDSPAGRVRHKIVEVFKKAQTSEKWCKQEFGKGYRVTSDGLVQITKQSLRQYIKKTVAKASSRMITEEIDGFVEDETCVKHIDIMVKTRVWLEIDRHILS